MILGTRKLTYVLGIDGGGTKTSALVANIQGEILGRSVSGASNYQSVGVDRAIDSIKSASEAAITTAGMEEYKCGAVCFGLAGVGRDQDREIMLPALAKLNLAEEIILEHDAAIALAGATAGRPGVVVLAGTGAMAYGMNRSGDRKRAGGWGNILGDEGSAYYIGRHALMAACKSFDGRLSKTGLIKNLMEFLNINDFTDIVKKIYGEKILPRDIASLAPIVSELAKDGDEVALLIIQNAAEELALTANAVIKGLDMEDEKFEVAMSGSVFKAGDVLLKPFYGCVADIAPCAEFISPKFDPAMGAILLALQKIGVELDI